MIPNRFHFVFLPKTRQPLHLVHYLCLSSCLAINRPEAVYFYYLHEPRGRYWELLKDRLIPVKVEPVHFIDNFQYADRAVAKYRYAHAADFVRLERLLDTGGVYADLDTLFVNPIPPALWRQPFVLGREADVADPATGVARRSLCNALIMAERNARFGRLWQEGQLAAFDGTWSAHSTLLPQQLSEQHPELVHIEPPRTFYPYMWTRDGLKTLLEGCDRQTDGIVSIHMWAHLWWSRWRMDFSRFHAGRITEDYVRRVDTTYNVLARPHLPPPEAAHARAGRWVRRQAEPVRGRVSQARHRLYVMTKLAGFGALARLGAAAPPRTAEHLDYARRQWRTRAARMPAGSKFEREIIFEGVGNFDEYELEQRVFQPDDVVIDIGAHVGAFTDACVRRGARRVLAFEPEIDNFRRLASAAGTHDGVRLYNLAVFRSDAPEGLTLTHSGHAAGNTGGGTVMGGGRHLDYDGQVMDASAHMQSVPAVALDEILEPLPRVRLLKLDCEGSEFPILLTSRLLDRVGEIVMEYHECDPEVHRQLDPIARVEGFDEYRVRDLQAHLEARGFDVICTPTAPYMGKLRALRKAQPA
jgi:FkbM family methyltransferase